MIICKNSALVVELIGMPAASKLLTTSRWPSFDDRWRAFRPVCYKHSRQMYAPLFHWVATLGKLVCLCGSLAQCALSLKRL